MRKLILATGLRGKELSPIEEIDLYKRCGFDGVFTDWGEDFFEIAKKIKAENLTYQSVHAPFIGCDQLWKEGKEGDKIADRLIACLRDSDKVGVHLVIMHAFIGFDYDTKPNEIGIDRFGKIFQEAKKLGTVVAVENTEGEEFLDALQTAFVDDPTVGFCIDTGHEMCYNRSKDLITKYGKKLVATHLNDNLGITGEKIFWLDDAHLLPFDGIADWQGIADRLNRIGYKGELTFELTRWNKPDRHTHDIYADLDVEGFVKAAYARAQRFRDLVEGNA